MKVYKQKINYHNLDGDFPVGTLWKQVNPTFKYHTDDLAELPIDFIENNPDIFEEYTKEYLLEEAIKKYPIGAKVYAISSVSGKVTDFRREINSTPKWIANVIDAGCNVYLNGVWAEVIHPLFKTEDGVNIYDGDTFYEVWLSNLNIVKTTPQRTIYAPQHNKYFASKDIAKHFVDEECFKRRYGEPMYSKKDIELAIKSYYSEINKRLDEALYKISEELIQNTANLILEKLKK